VGEKSLMLLKGYPNKLVKHKALSKEY